MIDSHTHYDHKRFDGDRKEILSECRMQGITSFINCATTYESNIQMMNKLNAFPYVYYGIGIHPARLGESVQDSEKEWIEDLRQLSKSERVVAIGETGLDYHHFNSEESKLRQQIWFERQLMLAQEEKLPVILHIREAHQDAIRILRKYPLREKGVVHCFSGDLKDAVIYTEEMGLYLGIGTKILDPAEAGLQEAVRYVALDKILLETDAPYLPPKKQKGGRNTSLILEEVVAKIAEIKGVSEKEMIDITTENVKNLFGRDKEWEEYMF